MLRGVVRDSVVIALISLILEYLSSSTGLLSVFVESMSQSLQISLGFPLEENTQLISTIGKLKGCCDEGTRGANICGTLITYGHNSFWTVFIWHRVYLGHFGRHIQCFFSGTTLHA
jgi:hypothetical protein